MGVKSMDGTTFDRWTRLLAARRSRRAVVGGLAAVAATATVVTNIAPARADETCGIADDPCASVDDCCGGFFCDDDQCQAIACGEVFDDCNEDPDCCGGLICWGGQCSDEVGEPDYGFDGDPCEDDEYCFGYLVCVSGFCSCGGSEYCDEDGTTEDVVTPPNTGAGVAPAGLNLAGAAAIAGAAALAGAALKARQDPARS
jgi:hypothetical protein